MRLIDADAFADWVDRTVPADTTELLISKSMVMAGLKTKSVTPTIEVAKDTNIPDKWISVKDRLPDKPGRYLCWFGKNITVKGATIVTYIPSLKAFGSLESLETYPNVTHWMPLPAGPKEKDDA